MVIKKRGKPRFIYSYITGKTSDRVRVHVRDHAEVPGR